MSHFSHGKAYILAVRGGLYFTGYPWAERNQIMAQDSTLKGQYGAGSIIKR